MIGKSGVTRNGAAVLLVVFAALGGIAGWAVDQVRGPEWTATATVLVQWTPSDVVSLLLNGSASQVGQDDLADVAGLATVPSVLTTVARQLADGSTASSLASSISAQPVTASHLVGITATADTGALAVRRAELTATALAAEQRAAVAAATADLPRSDGSPADLRVRAQVIASRVDPVQVVGAATPTQTRPSLTTAAALAVVGLAAAGLVIIWLSLRGGRRLRWVAAGPVDDAAPGAEPEDDTAPAVVEAAEALPVPPVPTLVPVARLAPSASASTVRLTLRALVDGWPERPLQFVAFDDAARKAARRLVTQLDADGSGAAVLLANGTAPDAQGSGPIMVAVPTADDPRGTATAAQQAHGSGAVLLVLVA